MENQLTDAEIQAQTEEKTKNQNRFETLSQKVIEKSKEKEAEAEARKKAEAERDSALKEAGFYKDFSANVTKYPEASNFQDKILEKVRGGYSTEDAMVSVLAKEGKLNTQSQPVQQNRQIEGGSAPTSFEGSKSISDMTTDEKLSALMEADKSGDLSRALKGW